MTEPRSTAEFEAFYQAHWGRLAGTLRLMSGDAMAADEVAQEAMTRAWMRWPRVSALDEPDDASTVTLCATSRSAGPMLARVSSVATPCDDCGEPRMINGLRVDRVPQPGCDSCAPRFEVPELQARLDIAVGPELEEQVLQTFTLSPVARALADGPTADVATWRRETERAVAVRVPGSWPNAAVESSGPAVASCGQSPLQGHPDAVRRGQGRGSTQCAVMPPVEAHPMDGLWLWTRTPDNPLVSDQAYDTSSMVDTIDLGSARVLVHRFYPPDHVYVVVDAPGGRTVIGVAINTDPTIARTVLRTITVDGRHLSASASSSSPPSTTTATTATPRMTLTTVPGPTTVTSTTGAPSSSTTTTTTTSPSQSTTTTSPSSAPRPTARDLQADLVRVGAAVDTAPPALWDLTRDIPSCSVSDRDDLYEGPTTGSIPEARCFFAALERHEPVSIIELAYSVEGDPIVFVTIVRPDGSIERFTDSSRDAFGSGAWSRQTCAGPLQPDPAALNERQLVSDILFSNPACATP